jgi:hypothetical protein
MLQLQRNEQVDWFRVQVDLGRAGWSLRKISRSIDIPRSTLDGWKQGARAPLEDGLKLAELWCAVTGNDFSELPRFNPYPPRHKPK